jgi:hypothetical protein
MGAGAGTSRGVFLVGLAVLQCCSAAVRGISGTGLGGTGSGAVRGISGTAVDVVNTHCCFVCLYLLEMVEGQQMRRPGTYMYVSWQVLGCKM